MKINYRRLPLKQLHNARDLGGHPLQSGGATRFGVFVRCAVPSNLPQSDIDFLREYGVTAEIDFRGDEEIGRVPSSLADVPGIAYIRRPTFNAQVAFASRQIRENPQSSPPVTAFVRWGEKYVEMSDDCQDWIAETLETLAEIDGCALYNCTTGKDRTGIISALMLGLAGCDEQDIIADYCVSEVHLQEVYRPMLMDYNRHFVNEEKAAIDSPFFKTEPLSMAQLLNHINSKYGGIREYVRTCGVSDAAVNKIIAKLTGG
ncbi:MAG: tyrosine-protein phosphatase [Oscillospiraceae bacterium]|jgi:protein-tyrosine phosphatase|nr:tyrosine-protein phosphatase [Oscillospiraceae bacterium]